MELVTYGTINITKVGYLFYLVNPNKCMFEHVEQVPRYVEEMFPIFILLALIENALRLLQGKPLARTNDTIASISQGFFQECIRIKMRSFEVIAYCFVWENYRITTMQWNSHLTWFLCFLGVDLGFYLFHRLSHEVNFLWAIHQAHHSPEDFTILSAFRQAALQPFTAWFAYLPMALCLPPSIFLTHLQLSELYMIWIHTEVIQTLGPLELILNTPSHHRVHHGRNRKYIDKNFGGTLIIWDRLFQTFQEEDPINEPVAYGLVHSVQSYNPLYLQFHHLLVLIQNLYKYKGFRNKLSVIWKGPAWRPGLPRLGDINQIPTIKYPIEYWSPQINSWQNVYAIVHFVIISIFYHLLATYHHSMSQLMVTYCITALLISITSIGLLLENHKYCWHIEILRCIAFLYCNHILLGNFIAITPINLHHFLNNILYFTFISSTFLSLFLIIWKIRNC